MDYAEADILVGKILKKQDDMSFAVKIQYGTRINRANYRGNLVFRPTEIVINGINYAAMDMDRTFLDKTLIDKQAMFVVRSSKNDELVGEMFKLPIGDYAGIEISEARSQKDSNEELQLAG